MAINMMCMNSDCVYYWEDNCTRNLEEKRIEIGTNGQCETFKRGVNDYYKFIEIEKPKCYRPSDNTYPLCVGAAHPQEFAENDCWNCSLYENMKHEGDVGVDD